MKKEYTYEVGDVVTIEKADIHVEVKNGRY